MAEKIVDLGCGANKAPGAFGVDSYPYDGVDLVADLNVVPWNIADNTFDKIICRHVIEHISNLVAFLGEVHRIARPQALLNIVTPHFSSVNSWADPTHRIHLSVYWFKPFLPDGYLARQTGAFELVSSRAVFGSSAWSLISRTVAVLLGQRHWEKYMAFRWPAADVETVLRVIK